MRRDALEKRGDPGGQGACRGLETRNQETQKAERGSVCSVVRSAILKSPTDYFFKIPHISNIPPGSSVHGISPARILEWVAICYSRGSSWPRGQTQVSCISCIGRQILYHWAIWEALLTWKLIYSQVSGIRTWTSLGSGGIILPSTEGLSSTPGSSTI